MQGSYTDDAANHVPHSPVDSLQFGVFVGSERSVGDANDSVAILRILAETGGKVSRYGLR